MAHCVCACGGQNKISKIIFLKHLSGGPLGLNCLFGSVRSFPAVFAVVKKLISQGPPRGYKGNCFCFFIIVFIISRGPPLFRLFPGVNHKILSGYGCAFLSGLFGPFMRFPGVKPNLQISLGGTLGFAVRSGPFGPLRWSLGVKQSCKTRRGGAYARAFRSGKQLPEIL